MVRQSLADAHLDRTHGGLDRKEHDICDTRTLLCENLTQCKNALLARKALAEHVRAHHRNDAQQSDALGLEPRFTKAPGRT